MQYVVFTVMDQYYGIATDEVEEISKTFAHTPVPRSQEWVEGLINLRGQILTLVNFDTLLNPNQKRPEMCYNHTIIAHIHNGKVALMIDKVAGIAKVSEEEMQSVSTDDEQKTSVLFPAFGHVVSAVDLTRLF